MTAVFSLMKVTSRELIREKILYSVLLLGILLLGVAYTSAQLTFISASRVVLDFGYTSLQIAFLLFGVLLGAQLLTKEFEQRTIWVILSKPISRISFIVGKYLGFVNLLSISFFLLFLIHMALYMVMEGEISAIYFVGFIFLWLQTCLIGSMALCISCWSTPTLSFIISLGLYLIGSNHDQIPKLFFGEQKTLQIIFEKLLVFIPNFQNYQLGLNLTYHQPISQTFIITGILQTLFWVALFLVLATVGIQKKEAL